MTTTRPLEVALAYHHAWTAGDLDAAFSLVAPDVTCDAPAGRLGGADALRAFMEPFARTLTHTELLAAFGDDASAVLVYDTASRAVPSAPASELYEVAAGRIVAVRIIFDRLPFALVRGEVSRTPS
ncbi:MAG: nuclear transport factor 2 family protein [Actinobacteria bacterium]|nr:nuclear transport factor 2 family protein [Actinomycetota bacterium]